MSSATADTFSYPAVEKRFVSSVLLAMLFVVIGLTFVTVAVGEEEPVLDTGALLALLGPIAMFLLAWRGMNQYANRADKAADNSLNAAVSEIDEYQYFPAWLGKHH